MRFSEGPAYTWVQKQLPELWGNIDSTTRRFYFVRTCTTAEASENALMGFTEGIGDWHVWKKTGSNSLSRLYLKRSLPQIKQISWEIAFLYRYSRCPKKEPCTSNPQREGGRWPGESIRFFDVVRSLTIQCLTLNNLNIRAHKPRNLQRRRKLHSPFSRKGWADDVTPALYRKDGQALTLQSYGHSILQVWDNV